jgi:hypothetical protein
VIRSAELEPWGGLEWLEKAFGFERSMVISYNISLTSSAATSSALSSEIGTKSKHPIYDALQPHLDGIAALQLRISATTPYRSPDPAGSDGQDSEPRAFQGHF